MLRSALDWLREMEREHLAVDIAYTRYRVDEAQAPSIVIKAVPGRTLFRAENDCGVTVRTEARDFLVEAADLGAEPQRGDLIDFDGGRYEVLAPDGEPVWRWSDAFRLAYRIHTKHIGEPHAQ